VIVVDDDLYVADTGNHTIRKVTSEGKVTTFAGTADQAGTTSEGIEAPQGVTVNSDGSVVYVASTGDHTIRKVVISTGAVTIFAGTAGSAGTTRTQLDTPSGVAVDSSGNVFVASTGDHSIQKITTSDTGVVEITHFAGSGTATAATGSPDPNHATNAKMATFNGPQGVAVDKDNNVYVADTGSHLMRKITAAGTVVTTIGGTVHTLGKADTGKDDEGNAVATTFSSPEGVAVDSSGNVYVVDTGNSTIRKITSAGVVTTFAGTGTAGLADGPKATATFNSPEGVAVVGNNIYVADTANHIIRKIELK